jgi:hypothetical protein
LDLQILATARGKLEAALAAPDGSGLLAVDRILPECGPALEVWLGCVNIPLFIQGATLDAADVDGAFSVSGQVQLCAALGDAPAIHAPARTWFFVSSLNDGTLATIELAIVFDQPVSLDLDRLWPDALSRPSPEVFWGALSLTTAGLVFSSYDFSLDGQTDSIGGGSLPAERQPTLGPAVDGKAAKLSTGLSFMGSIGPSGEVWELIKASLLKGVGNIGVIGAVTYDTLAGESVLDMVHAFATSASLKLSGLDLTLNGLRFRSGLHVLTQIPASIEIDATFGWDAESLAVSILLPLFGGPCTLSCAFDSPLDITRGLTLVGLDKVAAQLPAAADLGGLGLSNLFIVFDPADLSVLSVEAGVETYETWNLIPGVASVCPRFVIGKDLATPGAEAYAQFFADWRLGANETSSGILIQTSGDTATGQLAARMAEGERFDTMALFNALFPGVGLPEIDLVDFEIEGNYQTKAFSLNAEAISDWTLDIVGAQIGVSEVTLSADYDGSAFSGQVEGLVEIGGYAAEVVAILDGDHREIDLNVSLAPVGQLLDHLLFNVTLPDDIRDFDLENLAATFVPGESFSFTAQSRSTIELFAGFAFSVRAFGVTRTKSDAGAGAAPKTDVTWDLVLTLGGETVDFKGEYVAVGEQPAVWTFTADTPQVQIPLGHLLDSLVSLVGVHVPLACEHLVITDIAATVVLGAQKTFAFSCSVGDSTDDPVKPYGRFAFAIRQKPAGADGKSSGWDHVVAVEMDLVIGPELLPVVGTYLGSPKLDVTAARLTIAPEDLDDSAAGVLFGLINKPVAASNLSIDLAIGAETPTLLIPLAGLGAAPDPAIPGAAAQTEPAPAQATSTSTSTSPSPSPSPNDKTKWIQIQKTFGPVTIARLGLRYQSGRLALMFDARMALGAFSVELLGLGASSSLSHFDPEPTLDGLGFGFDAGPVSVSGGLMRSTVGGATAYGGELSLTTPVVSLTLVGEYIEAPQSLFIYGVLDDPPLGGPAYFFVEGVAIGVGYNSHLALPTDAQKVADFSLVKAAFPPTTSKADLLVSMSQDFSARPGAGWFVAGIRFNSFKLIDSFALASIEVGDQLEVGLLGLSRASLPPRADDPIAFFEVGLIASFNPDRGVLKVDAALTPKSFVLSHDASVSGGYAFYMWSKDGGAAGSSYSAGDFVYSMGGYHPQFKIPAHYPRPARLQLAWQVSSELSIKGSCYFALTPHALMAGVSMEALFSCGDLSAWFDADADFLLTWKPFHYMGHIDCSIGVSYRLNLGFTSCRLTVHVRVGLDLHGPAFGGSADIDLSVVSFTISFGASEPARDYIGWTDFRTSFLHVGDKGDTHTPGGSIQPVAGLVRDLTKTAKPDAPRWVFRAEDVAFSVRFAAPARTVSFQDGQPSVTSVGVGADLVSWNANLAVGPMGPSGAMTRNDAVVELLYLDEGRDGEPDKWQSFNRVTRTPDLGGVAASLWRPVAAPVPSDPDINLPTMLGDALCGYKIAPPSPIVDTTFDVDLAALRYEDASAKQPLLWSDAPSPTGGAVSGTVAGDVLTLKRTNKADIVCKDYVLDLPRDLTDPVTTRRAALIEAMARQGMLGSSAADRVVDVETFATKTQLNDWPRICVLGENLVP